MGNINGHETRVTAAWLRMRLAEAETAQRICLIDATPGEGPCLPYARPLDLRAILSTGMPTPEEFQGAVRAIGATSFDQVVIYDRNIPLASSILWRLFRCFGHRDACILSGGYDAWCSVSGELVEGYSKHEAGTWRAAGATADGELVAEIDALRQMFRES
jgi:3-mercaptopyruvate sulfurtransferase SseA